MNKVYRCYVEKREGFNLDSKSLFSTLKNLLKLEGLTDVRIFNRYDVQGIDDETYADACINVFSEPQCDDFYNEELPELGDAYILAVEALPGQYDQRADSCEQCIQIMTSGERPTVKVAKLYAFFGKLSDEDIEKTKSYLINPVDSRVASLEKYETLSMTYSPAEDIEVVKGFIDLSDDDLAAKRNALALAMDFDDIKFLQSYFKNTEKRDPTITEIRMIDTYWSDHCRHTTFSTHLKSFDIADPAVANAYKLYIDTRKELYGDKAETRPITLMDIATCAVKALKKRGMLPRIDESEEINACSVHVTAKIDGKDEDWLLMFKNETHNHPTEIEPFGGAATCLGGAIRDPLSGRSYVYQAMRVTGSADPRAAIEDTLPGKLPQRRITQTAAAGYSSYGNQIGLATGVVHEVYHPKYVAKRMEIGAVLGAAPYSNVVRERPQPGDYVILLGGRTGRDGCGGATGSSKSHSSESLLTCGAEVQKGNPTEERKLQRLFRNPEVTRLIKRCNDFGAGGVSVAIGELADSLAIDLDKVPKKYDGLDGTELAISESQERMAVVVAAEDAEKFAAFAASENIEATIVAKVTDTGRLQMTWRGNMIVDISRDFLNTNGAFKSSGIKVADLCKDNKTTNTDLEEMLSSLAACSQRGLGERFDGSIGAASVFAPYGGSTGLAPAQAMVAKLPAFPEDTSTVSGMAFGYDPYLTDSNPFIGASSAVVESLSKLISSGFSIDDCYLTFQEYFERLGTDESRWGKPFSALLGSFEAQMKLGIASIGGKDSMSGSFMDIDVPPTLVSFAVASAEADNVIVSEFQKADSFVYFVKAPYNADGTPDYAAIKANWKKITEIMRSGKVLSSRALTSGGIGEAVFKMAVGNNVGFKVEGNVDIFEKNYGGIILECAEEIELGTLIGKTTDTKAIEVCGKSYCLCGLTDKWQATLEGVFPTKADGLYDSAENVSYDKRIVVARSEKFACPKAVIPVFPGTNCEYDTARAVKNAGGDSEIIIVRNLTQDMLADSIEKMEKAIRSAQMIIIPGGFSGGDEPDGSGKFIASFFRNERLTDAVHDLLYNRDGLMLGICNGFQALIKLGLVPYGKITPMDQTCPTLTFNAIGRHQAKYVNTRVASVKSPWLSMCNVGDVHTVPVSHGEGRFAASEEVLKTLIENGQIAFQYVDENGNASTDINYNPNGSVMAIEGITSPDGRVLGKMAHTERTGKYIGMNIRGNKYQPIFESGVKYFK